MRCIPRKGEVALHIRPNPQSAVPWKNKWASWTFGFLKFWVGRTRKIALPEWQVFFQSRVMKNIITVDKKYVFYENVQRKSQWINILQRPSFTEEKLCSAYGKMTVWLYILCFKRNADFYSQHLQRVNENIRRKRPALVNRRNIVLLIDNTRPRLAIIELQKYLIYVDLIYSIHHIYQTEYQLISIFLSFTKSSQH